MESPFMQASSAVFSECYAVVKIDSSENLPEGGQEEIVDERYVVRPTLYTHFMVAATLLSTDN